MALMRSCRQRLVPVPTSGRAMPSKSVIPLIRKPGHLLCHHKGVLHVVQHTRINHILGVYI